MKKYVCLLIDSSNVPLYAVVIKARQKAQTKLHCHNYQVSSRAIKGIVTQSEKYIVQTYLNMHLLSNASSKR